MSEIVEIAEDNFEKVVIDNRGPVLVNFWASWSGPCQVMAPVISDLALLFEDQITFAICNIDTQPSLADRYNITSVPALIIFNKGEPVEMITGSATTEQVSEHLIRIFADMGITLSM